MAKPVEADVVLSCSEHLPTVDVWLVIDVLRATTVIVRWFELGGRELYPTDTPDAARRLAHDLEVGIGTSSISSRTGMPSNVSHPNS